MLKARPWLFVSALASLPASGCRSDDEICRDTCGPHEVCTISGSDCTYDDTKVDCEPRPSSCDDLGPAACTTFSCREDLDRLCDKPNPDDCSATDLVIVRCCD